MRAVFLGLLGAVLSVGLSQAKVCQLDRLEVVAASRDGSDVDQGLVGARFKVVKKASSFRTIPDNVGTLGTVTAGWIEAELAGKKRRYVLRQDYIPHSSLVETGDRCDARGAMCSFNGTVPKVK